MPISAVPGGYTVSWGSTTDATVEQYQVFSGVGTSVPFSGTTLVASCPAPATEMTVLGQPTTALTVYVVAVNGASASPPSSALSVTPLLAPPSDLAPIGPGRVLANTGTISAAPAGVAVSGVLDVVGSARGDVLYRGASGWAALPPGSAGQVLQTGGSGADPSWAAGGGGGGVVLTNGTVVASGTLTFGANLTLSGSGSAWTLAATGGGGGGSGITSLVAASPLTGGTITSTGTIGLPSFAGSAAGAVPASSGGTANFLRADGAWATPPGGGSLPAGLIQLIDFTTASGPAVRDVAGRYPVFVKGWTSGAQSADGFATDGTGTFVHASRAVMGLYAFTIAVRFKTVQSTVGSTYWQDPSVYALALNGTGNDGGMIIHNGYLGLWCSPDGSDFDTISSVFVSDDAWHTAVMLCDGVAWRLYCDGVDTGVAYTGNISLSFGDRPGSSAGCFPNMGAVNCQDVYGAGVYGGLAATFSQLRAYNYGLSPAEVAALDLTTIP